MFSYSESPATLLESMSNALAGVRDPRARHWLILPGRGQAEWVLRRWAQTTGIASHSQEVRLRELIEQAAAGQGPRFNFQRLRLAIAQELPLVAALPNSPLPRDAKLTPISASVLDWADSLATAIDETLLCRPRIDCFKDTPFLASLAQTPAVKEALAAHIGSKNPAEFETSTQLWTETWTNRGGVPHLWIALDAGLPANQYERFLQLLEFLKKEHPERVHLHALCPSQEYWADCVLKRQPRRGSSLQDLEDLELHPGGILWAFGRCSQDLQRQLSDTFLAENDGGRFLESPEPPPKLLGTLQRSCRLAKPLAPEDLPLLDPDDASFTVHSCRSALRELELCRDRILQAREEMEDLRYEDILVLLVDPKRQAPFLEAAFRQDDATHNALPFRLLGFGQTVPSVLAESLQLLLEKLRGRLGLEDVQILIENPLISEKFGLREVTEDGQDLVGWLRDAQFRWGLDVTHREAVQGITEPRWNLSWALQRLGLGAVLSVKELHSPVRVPNGEGETIPIERAAGLSLKGLARLALFFSELQNAQRLWTQSVPLQPKEWNTRLAHLVGTFLDCSKGMQAQHHATLFGKLLPDVESAFPAESSPLTEDGYLRLLKENLAGLTDSGARGPGGVCVADLRQYAGVPARMILVAGLDDGAFPRRDERPTWHPLSQRRKTGDLSVREADRHALLLAMLACKERMVFSFQGGSDEDAKELPPCTALADLLQAVDSIFNFPEAHAGYLFKHALNGFSPGSFKTNGPKSQLNRLKSDFHAARLLRSATQPPPFPGPWQTELPPETVDTPKLSLDTLHQLVREPAKIFLQRLGITLPHTPEALTNEDILSLDGLSKWNLRDELLFACVEGKPLANIVSQFSTAGKIPRGTIGADLVAKLENELPHAPDPAFTSGDRINRSIRLTLHDRLHPHTEWSVEGQLRNGWYRRQGTDTASFFTASKHGLKSELQLCLDAMTLAASFENDPAEAPSLVEAHFKTKDSKKPGKNYAPLRISLPSPAIAREFLQSLLPLYQLARCIPLPFWPGTAEAVLDSFKKAKINGTPTPAQIDKALEAGLSLWTKGTYGGEPEADSPATRYAFQGCSDPLRWNPRLTHPATQSLPEGGSSLAWRLLSFIHAFKSQVGIR